MKRKSWFLGTIMLLLAAIGLAGCGAQGGTTVSPSVVQSPQTLAVSTATALPPMAAKATAAAIGAQHTPQPTPTFQPIESPQDVINIVLNDPGFQANLDDPMFGPYSKGATPGEPIFVKSISPEMGDYYLVPFFKDDQTSGVAVVGVKNGAGKMGMWANASGRRFPSLSIAEVKSQIEAKGIMVAGEPRLVFRRLREGGDETDPFWEVEASDGTIFYVIHVLNTTSVYRADKVHPID